MSFFKDSLPSYVSFQQSTLRNIDLHDLEDGFLYYHEIFIDVFGILTIIGNILTLVCILKYRTLRGNRYMLVASLSIADLLVGLGLMIQTSMQIQPFEDDYSHARIVDFLATDFVIRFPTYVSLTNMLPIALDKFVAIIYPLHYPSIITKKSLTAIIVVSWVLPLLLCLMMLLYGLDQPLLEHGIFIIPGKSNALTISTLYTILVILLVAIYMKILSESNKHAKRIHIVGGVQPTSNGNTVPQERQAPKITKAQKGILLILGAFVILYMPIYILCFISLTDHYTEALEYFELITLHSMLLNSCMNIIVYAIYNRDFREAYRKIWCCGKIGRENNGLATSVDTTTAS